MLLCTTPTLQSTHACCTAAQKGRSMLTSTDCGRPVAVQKPGSLLMKAMPLSLVISSKSWAGGIAFAVRTIITADRATPMEWQQASMLRG